MSLSVGPYAQSYSHPGMSHEIYQYQQVRYPEHPDPAYFQNWVLNATQDLPVGQEHHYMADGTPSPTDYHHPHHHHYGQYQPQIRHVKRKGTANKKERRRTLSINSAFSNLRGCIPNVPTDTKLSKIKTLRLATSYITYLMDVLSKDDPTLTQAGFKADLSKKTSSSQHANSTLNVSEKQQHIKKESEGDSSDSASSTGSVNGSACANSADDKKNNVNGRTGWPQHVWAAELKQ